jgi:hypothetical protein
MHEIHEAGLLDGSRTLMHESRTMNHSDKWGHTTRSFGKVYGRVTLGQTPTSQFAHARLKSMDLPNPTAIYTAITNTLS